jgi:hypothetical protein
MTTSYTKLLRRTLAVFGAGIAMCSALPVAAQGTVTLSSGASCTYQSMTVLPNGSIQVTCAGGPIDPPPPPLNAVFSISGTTTTGAPNGTGTVRITRTGGPAGLIWFSHSLSGSCHSGTAPLAMDKDTTLDITYVLLNSGACTISITSIPSPHTVNTASWTINIGSGGTGPVGGMPPVPAGCPAIPDGTKYQTQDKWFTLNGTPATAWNAVDQLRMQSNQVAIYDVINPPDPLASVVNKFTQGQQGSAPSGTVITEITVSKCPGVISSAVPECYISSTFQNQNEISIFTAPIPFRSSQAEIGVRGCFAPLLDTNGQLQKWYVNVRWQYTSCSISTGCGFTMQWAQGSNY